MPPSAARSHLPREPDTDEVRSITRRVLPLFTRLPTTLILGNPVSGKRASRKLSFRCKEFSETQFMPLLIIENPICRSNSMRSGRGYARTHERLSGVRGSRKLSCWLWSFSETELPVFAILGNLVSNLEVSLKLKVMRTCTNGPLHPATDGYLQG